MRWEPTSYSQVQTLHLIATIYWTALSVAPVRDARLKQPSYANEKSASSNCRHTVLNRFLPEAELILERWDAGWTVTLYRRTANGLRSTRIFYTYAD